MKTSSPLFKIFITGMPGAGKTTCIQNVVASLRETVPRLRLIGFYTQECRDANSGQRLGFDIFEYQTAGGNSSPVVAPLARVGSTKPTVGKYAVNVENVRKHMSRCLLAQPSREEPTLAIIDEVGKMELHCAEFFPSVESHLNKEECGESKMVTIGTLPMPKRPIEQVSKILARKDVMVLHLTKGNRDQLTTDLSAYFACIMNESKDNEGNIMELVEPYLYKQSKPSKQANKEQPKTDKYDSSSSVLSTANSTPCGPLVSSKVAPTVLLLGETASPMPASPEMAYSERSMWSVLSRVLERPRHDDAGQRARYVELTDALGSYGVAVWDVFSDVHVKAPRNKKRRKSEASKSTNDVRAFLTRHVSVRAICFVGTKARDSFRKHFSEASSQDQLTLSPERSLDLLLLPSSSTGNRTPLDEKVAKWKETFEQYGCSN